MTKEERERFERMMRAEAADPMIVVGIDPASGPDETAFVRMFQCHGYAILADCKCPDCGAQVPL